MYESPAATKHDLDKLEATLRGDIEALHNALSSLIQLTAALILSHSIHVEKPTLDVKTCKAEATKELSVAIALRS